MYFINNSKRFVFTAITLILLTFESCVSLTLNSDSSTLDFGILTKEVLNNGFIENDASTSNYALRLTIDDPDTLNWTINTKASVDYFSSTFGNKPSSDFQWRINSTGIYTSFTTNDSAVASGTGNATVDFDFKLLSDWNDIPSDYRLDIVFTISEDL